MIIRAKVLSFSLCILFTSPIFAVNDSAILADEFPTTLSSYEFFKDLSRQIPEDEVIPYNLITVLFTDYAEKNRFVYVPARKQVRYFEDSVFDFPVGSALIKTFSYFNTEANLEHTNIWIETRLLLRKKSGWETLVYVWNNEQTEAYLKLAGKTIYTQFKDLEGNIRNVRYRVPNKNQCKECHSKDDVVLPIGPKQRNLNRDFDYSDKTMNQLDKWFESGIINNSITTIGPVADANNTADDIGRRARAYLDINCGHCHSHNGSANSTGLYLDYNVQNAKQLGVYKSPVAAGLGSGSLKYSIVPGNPDASILLFRMTSNNPAIMMPETGRSMVHKEGVALIREWIQSLENK